MAVPMAWYLLRAARRRPPGAAAARLRAVDAVPRRRRDRHRRRSAPNPVGHRAGAARAAGSCGAGYRLGQYLALTVLLLYAGNLSEAELPKRRLVRLLGWLFVVTVAGGLLGMVAGTFEFTSPVELLLPHDIRDKGFVQSLVHPYAAQIMDILGDHQPRPAAPWGYTNTWGNNFCLLVVWFVRGGVRPRDPPPHQAARAWPASRSRSCRSSYSLNRGLWIGLGVAAVYVAVRLALAGRLWVLGALVAARARARPSRWPSPRSATWSPPGSTTASPTACGRSSSSAR